MVPPRARPARAWRFARLASALAGAALAAGACQLDDRELSSEGLTGGAPGGNDECPGVGESACETCLYQECCAEVQDCASGSPCARYLTCATNCAGDELCVSDCGDTYPAGFVNAVSFSVCASGRCSVCSGQPATDGCAPGGAGACQSVDDCSVLESGALEDLDVVSACPACGDDLLGDPCERCLSEQTGLSRGICTYARSLMDSFESAVPATASGPDPYNRLGEFKSRSQVLKHIWDERFMNSIKPGGFCREKGSCPP